MLVILLSVPVALIVIVLSILLAFSPGKPKPFLDENRNFLKDSLSEKIFVTINGRKQGMIIKSQDICNPVLLYLHGGLPDYFLNQKYPSGLENIFTVVWWEQPGSGISYHAKLPGTKITSELLIDDAIELTKYLQQRFGKEKIYLMGHSGGTFIGLRMAARFPELFHAYLGVAQMTNQLQSEKLAYDFMLKQYTNKGDAKMLRKLKAAPVTIENGIPAPYLSVRDKAMHELGIGTMYKMNSVVTGIFFASLQCRDYSLKEKFNLWRGKAQSGVSLFWDEALKTDLSEELPDIKLPVYFFEGIYDFTCSYKLAKDYFLKLKAPVKGFYIFEHSAHSPLYEEPEKMQRILIENVLNGTNTLSDFK